MTSAIGIEPARILSMILLNPLCERLFPPPLRFVACRQQHEGRMITIGFNHPVSFLVEHLLHRGVRTDLVPHSRLRLQIEAKLIGSFEGGFRWTPGMKAHVVQAPLATSLE